MHQDNTILFGLFYVGISWLGSFINVHTNTSSLSHLAKQFGPPLKKLRSSQKKDDEATIFKQMPIYAIVQDTLSGRKTRSRLEKEV